MEVTKHLFSFFCIARRIAVLLALSLLDCLLIALCALAGCRLIDDVYVLFMDPTPALVTDIFATLIAAAVLGFLASLSLACTVIEILQLFDAFMPVENEAAVFTAA